MKVIPILALFALTVVTGSCTDRIQSPDTPNDSSTNGLLVSNPVFAHASIGTAAIAASVGAGDGVVYVSLPRGTQPNATRVQIVNQTTGTGALLVPVVDGGFDPYPITARAGDELGLTFSITGSGTLAMNVKVPVRRPPSIVRSDPSKGRVDVALSVIVTVVFTEPVDPSTINASTVRLLRNGTPVAGKLELPDNSLVALFTPDALLAPGSAYEVTVSPAVRDLDGDGLESTYTSSFITGVDVGSTCSQYHIPSMCPPFQPGGPNVLTGVVNERTVDGIRPLAYPLLWGFVDTGPFGYSRGWLGGGADGRYQMDNLPNGHILVGGWNAVYDQPCITSATIDGGDATADVELVSVKNPLPDLASATPRLTGVVYEETPGGRRPLAGARLEFDAFVDLIMATTTTDENGRYAMCRLPAGTRGLFVGAPGLTMVDTLVSIGAGETRVDVTMQKQ